MSDCNDIVTKCPHCGEIFIKAECPFCYSINVELLINESKTKYRIYCKDCNVLFKLPKEPSKFRLKIIDTIKKYIH